MTRFKLSILAVCLLLFSSNAFAQFSSGGTGAQGAFPPAAITNLPGPLNLITINLTNGVVSAYNSNGGTLAGTATLPGGAVSGDAFPSGELNFTTFSVPNGYTLRFVPNSQNTPVTIKTTGDATVSGSIDIKGGNGTPGGAPVPAVGKGGVGGANGGAAGSAQTEVTSGTNGGAGLGRNGGKGGSAAPCDNNSPTGGSFPHNNPLIIPLTGGSGGGGGGGYAYAGATGGGGGGAILIASSTKIVVTGTIDASGGAGGEGQGVDGWGGACNRGAGGSGGAIRLVANRLEVSGTLYSPGAGAGIIRLEAFDFVSSGSPNIAPAAVTGGPVLIQPVTLPRLRIASIGGVAVPTTTTDISGMVDVGISSGSNPMAVVVTGGNIPSGTGVTLIVKAGTSSPIATETSTLQPVNNVLTASFSITVPTGVSYFQAFTSQFTLSAELQQGLPLFKGEKVLQASVEFDGERQHVYYYTASGEKVSSEALLGQR